MDALQAGRSLRALRLRRRFRQVDVAAKAGISRSQVARIERGEIEAVAFGDIESVARVLGADLDLRVRWHGEGLDRLLDAAHGVLVDGIVRLLRAVGWEVAVEVSFNIYGERGSIDVLAFHPPSGALLVVEVKSVVPDLQAMLLAHDRKARLATRIGDERGWKVAGVSRLLVVGEGTTARRRVRLLDSIFRSAYPARTVEMRSWLRAPTGSIAGLMFLPYGRGTGIGNPIAGRQRVRCARRRAGRPG